MSRRLHSLKIKMICTTVVTAPCGSGDDDVTALSSRLAVPSQEARSIWAQWKRVRTSEFEICVSLSRSNKGLGHNFNILTLLLIVFTYRELGDIWVA